MVIITTIVVSYITCVYCFQSIKLKQFGVYLEKEKKLQKDRKFLRKISQKQGRESLNLE